MPIGYQDFIDNVYRNKIPNNIGINSYNNFNIFYNMKDNLICYLFGHKTAELNDSGYPVCERCDCHSYYDDWNNCAKLLKPFTFIVRFYYKSKYNVQYWYDTKFNGSKLPF